MKIEERKQRKKGRLKQPTKQKPGEAGTTYCRIMPDKKPSASMARCNNVGIGTAPIHPPTLEPLFVTERDGSICCGTQQALYRVREIQVRRNCKRASMLQLLEWEFKWIRV